MNQHTWKCKCWVHFKGWYIASMITILSYIHLHFLTSLDYLTPKK